jgi:UDP-N-acetylglucosamine 2-epimerase
MIKILNVAGARPNFMKVAPLVHEMNRHADIVPQAGAHRAALRRDDVEGVLRRPGIPHRT